MSEKHIDIGDGWWCPKYETFYSDPSAHFMAGLCQVRPSEHLPARVQLKDRRREERRAFDRRLQEKEVGRRR